MISERFPGFPHILEAQQFSREWIEGPFFREAILMDRANTMQERVELKWVRTLLEHQTMVQLFYEESTRTRASFSAAMLRLGGQTMFSTENAGLFSSAAKGEILTDTIQVLCQYKPNVIVLRHHQDDASKEAAKVSSVPIINAGDGKQQHPTQALLDIFTIQKELGRIDNLRIAMVGDLEKSRVVRSLCYNLGKFEGVHIDFVSPTCAQMKPDIKAYLERRGIVFSESTSILDVAPEIDVIYQTRVQKERGSNFKSNDRKLGYFTVDGKVLERMKKDAIIMHPLPRVDEIAPEVDADPRAAYFRQVANGLSVRMALLRIILAPKE